MPFVDIPHRNLHMYYVVNSLKSDDAVHVIDPAKPNLVLIHALCSSIDNYTAQFADPRLTNAYNLIAFDCRLHGRTTGADRQKHVLEDSANCVNAAINALGLTSYAVVGESFHGSYIGSYLAIKNPDKIKGLFFASPGWQSEPKQIRDLFLNDWYPTAASNKNGKGDGSGAIPEDALQFVGDYFFNNDLRTKERRAQFMQHFEKRYGVGHTAHDLGHITSFMNREPIPANMLASIKVPILLVHGEADVNTSPIAGVEGWRDSFKSARGGCDIRVIAGAPHMLLFTDYSIANRFILQFMSRHLEKSSTPPVVPASLEENKVLALQLETETTEPTAPAVAKPSSPLEYPEGGTRAYLTVAGASLCLCTCFGLSNSWGAFQAELKANLLSDYPPSTISWIGSTSLAILYMGGLPAGRLFDAGYCRYEIAAGSLLYLVGVYTLSVSRQFYSIFLSYSILTGIGCAGLFAPALSAIGTFFHRKRASMVGIAVASSALGSVAFPIMLNRLFAQIGFGPTIRAVAYLQTGCYAIVNLLMQPRQLPPKVQPPLGPTLLRFSRQPLTWVLSIGAALVMMGLWVPLFYIQVFLELNNARPVLITYCLAITNGSAVLGRISSGPTADRLGILNTATPVSFVTGVLAFALYGATSFAAAVTWLVLFGIANGLFITLLTPTLMTLAEDVTEIGLRVGYGLVFVAIATLIGSPIAGALLTATGSYVAPFCFGGGALIAGSALLGYARWSQSRTKKTWKV